MTTRRVFMFNDFRNNFSDLVNNNKNSKQACNCNNNMVAAANSKLNVSCAMRMKESEKALPE